VRKPVLSSGLLLAAAYLSLTLVPMVCSIDFADQHPAGHHHGGSLSHSSVCAWVCHASPTVGLVTAGIPSQSGVTVSAVYLKQALVMPPRSGQLQVSRGPPPSFPVL
jgi:hypothetical protein